MLKHRGIPFLIIGLAIAIISLFFDFFSIKSSDSYYLGTSIKYIFTNFGDYINSFKYFDFAYNLGGIMAIMLTYLFPIIFILGGILVLSGINTRIVSLLGAIFILIAPLINIIYDIIYSINTGTSFGTLIGYLGIAFYLMLIGGIVCIVGSAINKAKKKDEMI